ncbi:UNVERIFIED_CONTAM: protein EI24 [Sesamum latifolium]|uniref:Protein EI24 n=1 Tax=Sesamum latifolium TaxID=2727402 RepID=A0AAW2UZE1_9LAMI
MLGRLWRRPMILSSLDRKTECLCSSRTRPRYEFLEIFMYTTMRGSMGSFRTRLKQVSLLWVEGFREACCLHRVVIYCRRSREVAIRTGQSFLLNGIIFLGSILVLRSVVIPTLQWLLPDECQLINYQESCPFGGIFRFYSFLRLGLIQLFYALDYRWLNPSNVFEKCQSFKYNDIAKYGFFAIEKNGASGSESSDKKDSTASQNTAASDKTTDLEGVMIGIAEQVYSVLLLSFFFLEVYITGFIPYIGKALNFLLLAWMYAYYCFEYKWNYSGVSLDKRLNFFECNWPFFAGFGSEADKAIASQRKKWKGAGLGRIPIFVSADYLSMKVLSLFPMERRQQVHNQKAL